MTFCSTWPSTAPGSVGPIGSLIWHLRWIPSLYNLHTNGPLTSIHINVIIYDGPNQLLFTITDISNLKCWYQQFQLLISLIIIADINNCNKIVDISYSNSWAIGRAATLLKTLLQYYGKFLASCCLPQSPGQPQHHKYQNWIWKKWKKKQFELLISATVLQLLRLAIIISDISNLNC